MVLKQYGSDFLREKSLYFGSKTRNMLKKKGGTRTIKYYNDSNDPEATLEMFLMLPTCLCLSSFKIYANWKTVPVFGPSEMFYSF